MPPISSATVCRRGRPHHRPFTRRVATLGAVLLALIGFASACTPSSPTPPSAFAPPYLRMRLCEGEAQWQPAGTDDWEAIALDEEFVLEAGGRVTTGATEGARFCLGDGSSLELSPASTLELRNPGVLPRLELTPIEGHFLFEIRQLSYELTLPVCPVDPLGVPTRFDLEAHGETMRLEVLEGSINCSSETEMYVLFPCWVMEIQPQEEPKVYDGCAARATATARYSPPSPTRPPRPTPTPTFTPSPTRPPVRVTPTATPTPLPPTSPPPPPPPPPTSPPRPTDTPVPPTDTPLPPPTDTPTRPTPTPQGG